MLRQYNLLTRMKIFHVVENLDKGAVENWLVNIFLESRKYRPEWKWTFYCILGKEGRLDESVRAAGGEIIYSPCWISEKLPFLRHLRHTLKKGDYDILHVHHDYLSGFYLTAAIGLTFQRRFLHVHNTDKSLPLGSARARRLLLRPLRYAALRMTDKIIGISADTLDEFLAGVKLRKGRSAILYYGIDLSKFYEDHPGGWLNREMDIPSGMKVLLFAGRMNELKNPGFVIDILHALQSYRKDVIALFVGEGGEKQTVIGKSSAYGLEDKVRLAGWRNDLSVIMQQSDLFVFPRIEYPKEGLGLVVVEAQSAGLPMVLSHGIVPDAIVIPELASFIPLKDNPGEWAAIIHAVLEKGKPMPASSALQKMTGSRFNLPNATKNLIALYEEQ